jgi:hypothetical protein
MGLRAPTVVSARQARVPAPRGLDWFSTILEDSA